MTRRLLSATAALVFVLSGCGDDDTDDSTATPDGAGETSTTVDAADGAAPQTDAVVIRDFAFDPASTEVPAGTTVTWTNEDSVGHTVTAGAPGQPDEAFGESVDAGGEATVTFDEAGTFPYFCSIHPTMTGEVVVS